MKNTSGTVFSLTGVTCGYGDNKVLSDLNLEIEEGSFIGIVGRNGAGKTTLFRLLTNELQPRTGAVSLFGRRLHSYSSRNRARLLAVVAQTEDMVFPYTVAAMVLLGRGPHLGHFGYETEKDVKAAQRAMVLAGVQSFADRKVTDLSGGELHRVLIARALAQETPILLLDEPNAHLDLRHQLALFELLSRLHENGRTILCITHDLNLAASYCKRLLLIDDGRIAADGLPAEVLTEDNIARYFAVRTNVSFEGGIPIIRLQHAIE